MFAEPINLNPGPKLLSRDEFRTRVFARDQNKCVLCKAPAQDAHHILERRLWPDGGYYLDNGASVCAECHLKAEVTVVPCEELREAAGITKALLPPHLYSDQLYDKWGNPVLPNGQRLRGELFFEESVQKVLEPVLHLFTDRVKYPRTYHLSWSPGMSSDDRMMPSTAALEGEEVIVTVKYDGEQTSMYRTGFHARSLDTPSHPSRDWLWGVQRRIGHEIPEGWRICAENLYAVHSIRYRFLPAHFLVYGMWDERNVCLPWDDTTAYCEMLGLKTVKVLWRGIWDEEKVRALDVREVDGDPCEGYVVRVVRAFQFKEFKDVVGKFVRKDHVHTHGHWMRQAVEVNGLAEENRKIT